MPGVLAACGYGFTIDGNLVEAPWVSGAWKGIGNVTVAPYGMAAGSQFKVYWDSSNLYVAVNIVKAPATLYAGTPLWSSDSVELYFDMNHNKSATYAADDIHYTFGWNNPVPDVSAGGSVAGVLFGYAATGNGWNAEIAIPWARLGVSPGAGALYGFDAAVNIASASGTRQCQLTWNSTTGTNYLDTSQFGDLTLGTACPPMSPTRTPTPSNTSAATATPLPTATSTPVLRGASLPFVEYEAEDAAYNGSLLGPSRTVGQIAAESSGRKAVQLNSTGQYVRFTAGPAANSIVVRYVIPDAGGGGGTTATLSLYVNGAFRQTLMLTSKYAWAYGGWGIPYNQNPSGGSPVHFYDEVHALVGNIPAGATVTLQRDAGDTAAYYVIDLIDLEMVGPAIGQPANSLNAVTNYGATGNGSTNDTTALQNCINAAQAQGKVAYIPAGTYLITGSLSIPAVAVQGAGMWYTTIHQTSDTSVLKMSLNNASAFVGDMLLLGEVSNRNDSVSDSGLDGHGGTNTIVQNVWVEHTKCAWWVGNTGSITNNLTITGCRFRDLYADAVNFCNGTSNSTVTNTHVRNSGDDGLASWSPSGQAANTNNLFSFNTVVLPWRANCIALYGGTNNRIQDNLVSDTSNYPGILVAQEFSSNGFGGTTQVLRNTLTRCGGSFSGTNHGAFKISTAQGGVNGITVNDMSILDATYAAVYVAGGNAVNSSSFSNMTISAPATWGLQTATGTGGTINCTNVVVTGAGSGGLSNPGGLNFAKISGNSGW